MTIVLTRKNRKKKVQFKADIVSPLCTPYTWLPSEKIKAKAKQRKVKLAARRKKPAAVIDVRDEDDAVEEASDVEGNADKADTATNAVPISTKIEIRRIITNIKTAVSGDTIKMEGWLDNNEIDAATVRAELGNIIGENIS